MPLRTMVQVSFTPIRRNQTVINSAAVLAAVDVDLGRRSLLLVSHMLTGYVRSRPKFYQRTQRLGGGWKSRRQGHGVRIYNDVEGTNWSNERVRYAQYVHGTFSDPNRQGELLKAWPLFRDGVNRFFLNAADDRSHAYARFLQQIMRRHIR